MTPTMVTAAVFLLGATVVIIVLVRGHLAGGSDRRRSSMMERFGLSPEAAELGSRRTRALLKETRQRCLRCPREDWCERWLAGKVGGGNAFCPNAETFDGLIGAGGRTA